MKESEKFKEMLKRAAYSAEDKGVMELVSIAQGLMPEIEKGIHKQVKLFEANKSNSVTYSISMKDIVKKVNERHWEGVAAENISRFGEDVSTEGLFLIFSAVAWHSPCRIVTEINFTRQQCLGLWFRLGLEKDEEPSVESCTEQWMRLYQEA